ncbi:penicillin acylase family protein [bacterium]|nr:penicillin acylase family protein [bacterium]
MKFLMYVAVIACSIILMMTTAVYIFLRTTLPVIDGAVPVRGISGNVEVIRDTWGVPHIFAANSRDLYFSAGYVMAQDRLFQMDFLRRVGRGELSEILGEKLVPTDHVLRIFSAMWPEDRADSALTGEYRDIMEAYTEGVNAFIETHHNSLPVEFLLLGYRPEPWKITDGIYIHLYMANVLQTGWSGDINLLKLVTRVGPEMADEAMPPYSSDGPTIVPEGVRFGGEGAASLIPRWKLADIAPLRFDFVGGSNGWVLSGKKTTSGKPILCSDPHLALSTPSIWYEIHMKAEDFDVIGVSIPGFPVILTGNNRDIAWGPTNFMVDDVDYYIEKINPDNPRQYLFEGKWEDMKVVNAVINVKGKEPVTKEILITRHGPIVNDVKKGVKDVLSMRWTMNDSLGGIQCFTGIMKARNWKEFTDAVRRYHGPTQNIHYADRLGNIGYYSSGRIPIRAQKGDGPFPLPGWDGLHEWQGYVPFEQNPHLYNPECGYIVTANNKTVPDDYPYYISRYFVSKYRAQRITDCILGKNRLSFEDNMIIQNDLYSIEASETTPVILQALETDTNPDSDVKRAIVYLKTWDFVTDKNSVAACIFHAIQVKLFENIFRDEMGDDLFYDHNMRKGFDTILANENSRWFDDVSTPDKTETRDEIIIRSTAQAVFDLRERFGGNMEKWQWGKLHEHVSGHLVFRNVSGLSKIFDIGPFSRGGNSETINAAGFDFLKPYMNGSGTSTRQITDFADHANDVRVLTTGCSGQFNSRFYDNQTPLWLSGAYHPVLMERADIEKNAAGTLILEPVK